VADDPGEAHVPGDVGDRPIGLPEQCHGAFDPAALQIAVRGLAVHLLEQSSELRG
jgi:hypothetical protein